MVKDEDVRATFKVLVGFVLHLVWTLAIAGLVGWRFGLGPALVVLLALPLVGVVTVHVVEQWTGAAAQARRFFLRARRREEILALRTRQRELAQRLHALWEEVRERETG